MNNIKNTFTIKDLENLTGIKAHTIRIWEKRYNILTPLRTDTNIRVYDAHSLQKLLNINTLNTFGYKISTISKVAEEKLPAMVKEILSGKTINNHVLSNFKLSMMNFDVQLFLRTYEAVAKTNTFSYIFHNCFMQLLEEIGNLWQTGTITPAHEHFISNLIKQKIAVNTEAQQLAEVVRTDRVFVLYLPEGEIHEIGLMLLNYELLLAGFRTVYLGESVPLANIRDIKKTFDNITFITYLTVEPAIAEIPHFISQMKESVVNDSTTQLLIFGRHAEVINPLTVGTPIKTFSSIKSFTDTL
ncbi:MerR family transcriptional regulator [Flavobacterium sp. RHBU_24]|uniref:MerR family transcriptional regulator n=1 Tax=Flavobacterium sp. RHBU_24 TaxID=3391185 RepID=UPI0039850276